VIVYRFSLIMSAFIVLAIVVVWWWTRAIEPRPLQPTVTVQDVLATDGSQGFERAITRHPFRFPQDHGAHNSFKNEWWYVTGNLASADGREFGYQFTLFRDALLAKPMQRSSAWAAAQTYMAHLALADIASDRFYSFERFSRGAIDLAGADINIGRFWLEDWQLKMNNAEDLPTFTLTAREQNISMQLELTAAKRVVLHGQDGLSRKGEQQGQATYYYSITRLTTTGSIVVNGHATTVKGESWLDREWGTDALSPLVSGWDWFSIQLTDGCEFMYYQLRRQDGSADRCSHGTWIEADGASRGVTDVQLEVLSAWQDEAGHRYPAKWRIRLPQESCELVVQPKMNDQLLRTSIPYWEGAVRVSGTRKGVPLTGQGYVELTGYNRP
jgi:predicted secreted hydrolase